MNRSDRLTMWLVAWYGAFQAGHVVLNTRYLMSGDSPPFPPVTSAVAFAVVAEGAVSFAYRFAEADFG